MNSRRSGFWIRPNEAIRDLVRARQAAVRTVRQARQQLSGFLLRQGHHYNRPAWTLMHRRWLSGLRFEHAVHYVVLEDCIAAVEAATARRDRLGAHIEAALADWSPPVAPPPAASQADRQEAMAPVVRALQALRGLALVGAATSPASTTRASSWPISAWCRASTPAASGGLTKAGNGAARRMLIEAAWSYRFPARISRDQLLRQEALATPIRDTAWKAQERLCRRYRKLAQAGKPPTVVIAAIARELAGFVWAIAKQVPPARA